MLKRDELTTPTSCINRAAPDVSQSVRIGIALDGVLRRPVA